MGGDLAADSDLSSELSRARQRTKLPLEASDAKRRLIPFALGCQAAQLLLPGLPIMGRRRQRKNKRNTSETI